MGTVPTVVPPPNELTSVLYKYNIRDKFCSLCKMNWNYKLLNNERVFYVFLYVKFVFEIAVVQ